jgi:hypothetical protein
MRTRTLEGIIPDLKERFVTKLPRASFGLLLTFALATPAHAQRAGQPDWASIEAETMQHFQALLRFDTSDPPGNERAAVEYLKQVLEKEGIVVETFALEPNRPNLVARLRGNGTRRPLLVMGHTDVVNVDPAKWTHPPFGATREGGYVYGRGSVDDKDNVVTGRRSTPSSASPKVARSRASAAACGTPASPRPRRSRAPSSSPRVAPPGTARFRSRAMPSCDSRARSRRSASGARPSS